MVNLFGREGVPVSDSIGFDGDLQDGGICALVYARGLYVLKIRLLT
jgi:hypothetical protein